MAGSPELTEPQRATILDVAAAAGVSRQTVTRAMNGMPDIAPATRKRVLEAAGRLGYRPSRFGRGLVTGGAPQLGLVVEDLTNPYFPELAAAVVRAAAERGWTVLVGEAGGASGAPPAIVADTDAVLGYPRATGVLDPGPGVPVVGLDVPVGSPGVQLDRTAAVSALVAHLVAAGVRRPVVLDVAGSRGSSGRGALLDRAFAAAGIPARVLDGAVGAERGATETAALLASGEPPDAIVAFNDLTALGVLSAARRAGVEVPHALRVAGFDGLPLGALVAPTLTTVAVDLDEVAREAVDAAVALRAGSTAVERRVPARLVLRESA